MLRGICVTCAGRHYSVAKRGQFARSMICAVYAVVPLKHKGKNKRGVFLEHLKIKDFLKLLLASLVVGGFGGVIGTAFSYVISTVTTLRTQNGWLICLLPIAGLLVVLTYKAFSVMGVGTNHVLKAADGKGELSPFITATIFLGSAISHLFGASVGREGAALQLGGGLAVTTGKLFRLNEKQSQLLVRAGMAGVFSSVFGTPLTAAFFALEIVCVGSIPLLAVLPCFISSAVAFVVAHFLGAHAERFSVLGVPPVSFDVAWKVAVLTVLCVALGFLFCKALHFCETLFAKILKNEYIRIVVGGAVLLLLTVLVGNQDYNGAGITVIERIFKSGMFFPVAFLLKLLFTCISVGSGFKGGEIVPTLFIGATFGALVASLLGLPVAFAAALGMVLLFCTVTNCPLASLFLGMEMFSFAGFWYLIPTVLVVFLISGKTSLYHAQQRKILNF